MGFFSDLKEDLSQAVNELMPEELAQEAVTEAVAEETVAEDLAIEVSLEEMLKNIDDIQIPEDNAESLAESASEDGWMYKDAVDDVPDAVAEESAAEADLTSALEAEPVQYAEPQTQEAVVEETGNTIENEYKGAGRKMDSYVSREVADETAVITAGMRVCGDITSEGSLDVVGTVDGNIDIWGKLNVTGHINGNSKASEIYAEGAKINGEVVSEGAVKIGDSSVIIGNITAKSAAIAGAVKGDIDVQGPVVLDASAIVMGNIRSKSVQINNGAVIEGMCSQCYADVSPLSFFDEYKTEIKNSKKNK